ncbi:MAG: hypothetical protein ACE5D7_03315 [Fidelibacterota bacterium]
MSEITENQNRSGNKKGNKNGDEIILNTHQIEAQIKVLRQILKFDNYELKNTQIKNKAIK